MKREYHDLSFLQSMVSTHTFSPNWYRPQCLLFTSDYLLYCSNYILYLYDLTSRKILRDACMRKLALKSGQGMDSKNIKILTISQFKSKSVCDKRMEQTEKQQQGNNINNLIVLGTNQHFVIIFNIKKWETVCILNTKEYKLMSVSSIYSFIQKETAMMIISDEDGKMHRIELKYDMIEGQMKILQHRLIEELSGQKIKHISNNIPKGLSGYLGIIVNSKNMIYLYDEGFHKLYGKYEAHILPSRHQVNPSQQYTLSVDLHVVPHPQNTAIELSILSKNNKTHQLFLQHSTFTIYQTKPQQSESSQLPVHLLYNQRVQIKMVYPKIMLQKLKKHNKAAMNIAYIPPFSHSHSSKHILLTAKLGQIFSIYMPENPTQDQPIFTIKPHSLDQPCQNVEIWNDSKHYKQIYGIYQHQKRLYMVSTDQSLSIWSLPKANSTLPKHIYSIKFITSQIQSFFTSEADGGTLFFLLRDGVIRSMAPLGGSQFLNEYWKYTKKFNDISRAVCHLSEPGIVGMSTRCHRNVIVYDIYEDRLMRIMELGGTNEAKTNVKGDSKNKNKAEEIINLTFQYATIIEAIQFINDKIVQEELQIQSSQWEQYGIKINKYFQKQQSSNIGLLIQQKDHILYIYPNNAKSESHSKDYHTIRTQRRGRIERIHHNKLWNGKSILSTQNSAHKSGTKVIRMLYDGDGYICKEIQTLVGGRFTYKLCEEEASLYIIEYKNKKIVLRKFLIVPSLQTTQKVEEKQGQTRQFRSFTLNQILCSDISNKVSIAAQQLVLDYNSKKAAFYNQKDDMVALINFQKDQQIHVFSYALNSKIQSLSFFCIDYLAFGFKDQSVKVLKISDMEQVLNNKGNNNTCAWKPQKKVKKPQQLPEKEDQEKEEKGKKIMQSNEERIPRQNMPLKKQLQGNEGKKGNEGNKMIIHSFEERIPTKNMARKKQLEEKGEESDGEWLSIDDDQDRKQ